MTNHNETLTEAIRRCSNELTVLENRLKLETGPDPEALNDLRHVLDTVRLTAWGVSEFNHMQQAGQNPDALLFFITAEQVRRFAQLACSLSSEIEAGHVALQTAEMSSLHLALDALCNQIKKSEANSLPV